MPQTFQLIGQIGSEYELEVAEIVRDFGDGYDRSFFVGNSQGEEFVTLVFNVLTDRTSDTITDPEDMVVKTKLEYVKDFFLARKLDGAAFNVTTTRGETLLVRFAENRIRGPIIGKKAFSFTIRFRQHRT